MHDVMRLSPVIRFRLAATAAGSAGLIGALLALQLGSSTIGAAQPSLALRNDNIGYDYFAPREPGYVPLLQKLQKRQVLEELGQFLAPVKWPKKLRLIMKQCPSSTPQPEVFYLNIEYSLNVCYQFFRFLEGLSPPKALGTRQEVIVGALVAIVLHEAGRGLFDMLSIPRLGSEEDAADQIAGFVGLQFGPTVARTVIKGAYYLWDEYDYVIRSNPDKHYNVAGKASVPPQRIVNTLCIGYGGNQAMFQDFVDSGKLPKSRAENCVNEYQQVQDAFQKTILKNVDLGMMKTIQSATWLSPEDLK